MNNTKNTQENTSRTCSSSGFTVIELMVVVAILSVLSGLLITAMISANRSMRISESRILTQDNSRNAVMIIIRELRQARASSLAVSNGGTVLQYVITKDVNGNGWPLDGSGNPEYSPLRTLSVDTNDANNDGLTTTQLIRTEVGGTPKVLANNLPFGGGGITFTLTGNAGVMIDITAQDMTGPGDQGNVIETTLTETVTPRN
ncbi:MAG: prepilin-type N-terminal cleavage/methylation domain-containing protein [Candidatus Hydrogenedentota bacterium]